jgi:hypothetical protein
MHKWNALCQPKEWEVFARVDNLFNKHYENPSGFLRPGLGAYGGVRLVTSDWANLARMFERLGDGAPAYGPPIVRK